MSPLTPTSSPPPSDDQTFTTCYMVRSRHNIRLFQVKGRRHLSLRDSAEDDWLVDPGPSEEVRAVLTDELLLAVAGGVVPPDAGLPDVAPHQEAGLLLPPAQSQHSLGVVWLRNDRL